MGAGVAIGILAASSAARADPPTASLGWARLDGAEECIGPRDLAQAVEARLHREVFVSPARSRLLIDGRIAPAAAPDRWRAVLKLSNDKGVALGARELHSGEESCRALDKQLAFVIAVLIDPETALAPDPPGKPVTPPAPPARPPVAVPPIAAQPTPREPSILAPQPAPEPWRAGVTGAMAFSFGLLPGTAVGAEIRGHVTPPNWPTFEFGGTTWAAATARDGDRSVRFTLADAFVSICPLATPPAILRLSGCAGVRLGTIHTASFGFDGARDGDHAVFSTATRARIDVRIVGPLRGSLGLGLLAPITRYRFSYRAGEAEGELFKMWPIVAAIDAGLGFEFP